MISNSQTRTKATRRLVATIAFCAAAWSGPGLAQEPAADPGATPLEDVLVDARRRATRDRAIPYVREIIAPARNHPPARWSEPVCVGVMNLQGEAARYMADRVSTVASDLGLSLAGEGGEPNILIVATDDGDATARDLIRARPRDFVTGSGGMDRGPRALAAFRGSGAPVRWWHLSLPVDAYTGDPTVRIPGQPPPNVDIIIRHGSQTGDYGQMVGGSRLTNPNRHDLRRAVIVIDWPASASADLVQLTDYVALIALAQVDPEARVGGYDTILSLFGADTAPPPHLTDWDLAFLRGLYRAEGIDARSVGDIAAGMARALID